jgi:galactokinase
MADSHRRLRDDYGVSGPELDLLVELADDLPGGVRRAADGRGLRRCTVNLVHTEALNESTAGSAKGMNTHRHQAGHLRVRGGGRRDADRLEMVSKPARSG